MKIQRSLLLFIRRTVIIWIVPTLILVGLYVWFDPMYDLRSRSVSPDGGFLPNKGNVTVNNFITHNPERHYDSFMVGSSITISFQIADWLKYLPAGSRPFNFDSSAMSIAQMRDYIEWLTVNADSVRNVLIIIEPHILHHNEEFHESNSIVFRTPSTVESSPIKSLKTRWLMFSHWYSWGNLSGWVLASLNQNRINELIGNRYPLDVTISKYDPIINEESNPRIAEILERKADSLEKMNPHWAMDKQPYEENGVFPPLIDESMSNDLKGMADILRDRNVSWKFVIIPEKKGKQLNPSDKEVLITILGDNLLDISSPESPAYKLIRNPYNFFDDVHYTPRACRLIYPMIYQN